MFKSDIQRWLEIIHRVSQACGWDRSLLLTMDPDDRSFVVQVRKSALMFTVRQDAPAPPNYSVSYTVFKPGAPPDVTARRLSAGERLSAEFVSEQLEAWLRESVDRYVEEVGARD